MLPIFDRKPTIRNKIHKRESKLLKQNNKEEKEILPFVTQYQPSVSTIKEAWMKKWNLIQKNHQSFPYNKGKSLKNMLVRAEKKKGWQRVPRPYRCAACQPLYFLAQQVCEYLKKLKENCLFLKYWAENLKFVEIFAKFTMIVTFRKHSFKTIKQVSFES